MSERTCSSHVPILTELLGKLMPRRVLEIGSGNYSTTLLHSRAAELTTIEIGNRAWYQLISEALKPRPGWRYDFFESGAPVLRWLESLTAASFDLVFVDGPGDRWEYVNRVFKLAPLIVVHDSQHLWRDRIEAPEGFERYDFTKFPEMYGHPDPAHYYDDRPWTTVYSSEECAKSLLAGMVRDEGLLYERHAYPYHLGSEPQRPEVLAA